LQDKLTWKQVYVIFISLLTVAMWCANSWLQQWTGEMGIIAILPLVAFFGFGILGKVQSTLDKRDSLKREETYKFEVFCAF
jgi:di/tricarboxylate transporter